MARKTDFQSVECRFDSDLPYQKYMRDTTKDIEGTHDPEDEDVVICIPLKENESMWDRKMWDKKTGKFIPFGVYPNIDWS